MLTWMQNTIIFAIDDTPVLDLEADNYNPVYFSTTCKCKYISFAYPIHQNLSLLWLKVRILVIDKEDALPHFLHYQVGHGSTLLLKAWSVDQEHW